MQRDERGYDRNGEPQPSHADDRCRRSVDLLRRWQRNVDQQQCYGQCVEHGRHDPSDHGEHLGYLQRDGDQWQWMQRDERGYDRNGEPQPSHADDQCRRSVDLLRRWQRNVDQQQCYGQCVEHGRGSTRPKRSQW
jgi:hypothetical protein